MNGKRNCIIVRAKALCRKCVKPLNTRIIQRANLDTTIRDISSKTRRNKNEL